MRVEQVMQIVVAVGIVMMFIILGGCAYKGQVTYVMSKHDVRSGAYGIASVGGQSADPAKQPEWHNPQDRDIAADLKGVTGLIKAQGAIKRALAKTQADIVKETLKRNPSAPVLELDTTIPGSVTDLGAIVSALPDDEPTDAQLLEDALEGLQ